MQKKMVQFCFLNLGILVSLNLRAQVIENSINLYGANFPHEKIYVHFDKETYLPGETIWYKAYVFEENQLSERSTNFYAALYDENGKLLQHQMNPVFGATADGHFSIPDSLYSGQLICRAYTTWMLNFDTSFLFSKTIRVVSNRSVPAGKQNKAVSLSFFPEGGDIIEGVKNTIAFKANYNDGLPFDVEGVIKKLETGEVVMPLKAIHDGMGKFDLDFAAGEKYYAEWIDNKGNRIQTWLPEVKATGVSLKLTIQKDKLYYNIINKTTGDSLHVLMYMYQKIFYKKDITPAPGDMLTAVIPVDKLPSGVMQLTVFDASWLPLAERVAFINNDDFSINADLVTTSASLQKRGKNELELLMADTIPANMSLSITDADMNPEAMANNIISGLLLKGDIRGYIHDPAYYFSDNKDPELKNQLDLVMLTHGWRRYNWNNMQVQKTPVIRYIADEYLGVYGQISKDMREKIDTTEQVNLIIKTIDSTNNFYAIKPDKNGLLKKTGLVFYDSAKVYFSFNKNKINNKQIAFSTYNFTHALTNDIGNAGKYLLPDTAGTAFKPGTSLFEYYSKNNGIIKFNEAKTLTGVVVKTDGRRNWKNDPMLKMDETYATGMFFGGAGGEAFDVVHDEKAWTKLDIYNYIRSILPQIRVGNFNLTAGRSLTYINKAVLIYIDEHEMTTSDLESLFISDVAYIKFFPIFSGRGMATDIGVFNPALAFYTKKGDDLIDRRPTDKDLGMVKVAGYSPVKEFYSPDYATTITNDGTDARTTLLWLPYLFTDLNNRKIPITFYNNDFTKKFRIVLEGINDEGKMIHIEKIIE